MTKLEERWMNISRYSARQKRTVPISGIMVIYEIEGNLERILPILDFCSYLHIGKPSFTIKIHFLLNSLKRFVCRCLCLLGTIKEIKLWRFL